MGIVLNINYKNHYIIDDYIKWNNYQRLHSSLEYLTPVEIELKTRTKFTR